MPKSWLRISIPDVLQVIMPLPPPHPTHGRHCIVWVMHPLPCGIHRLSYRDVSPCGMQPLPCGMQPLPNVMYLYLTTLSRRALTRRTWTKWAARRPISSWSSRRRCCPTCTRSGASSSSSPRWASARRCLDPSPASPLRPWVEPAVLVEVPLCAVRRRRLTTWCYPSCRRAVGHGALQDPVLQVLPRVRVDGRQEQEDGQAQRCVPAYPRNPRIPSTTLA